MRKDMKMRDKIVDTDTTTGNLGKFFFFVDCFKHGGKPNAGIPPHRPLFPTIENAVAL